MSIPKILSISSFVWEVKPKNIFDFVEDRFMER